MTQKTLTIGRKSFELVDQLPQYGVNYNKGYIGFVYNDTSLISQGIVYFTKWDDLYNVPGNHALIVEDETNCIEAMMTKGIQRNPLKDYFENPHTHIFFRKPNDLNNIVAEQISEAASKEIGAGYANGLIINDALRGTLLGHIIDDLTHDALFDFLSQMMCKKGSFICSQLAAYSLKEAKDWAYRKSGVLRRPTTAITPQELFCDDAIFDKWK